MLEKILSKQRLFLLSEGKYRNYTEDVKDCVEILNTHQILAIQGTKHCGKRSLVKEIITKTGLQDSFFYFYPWIDSYNTIQTIETFFVLLKLHIKLYSKPKILILEDINLIPDIKSIFQRLMEHKEYKIIILWNNIKIEGIKQKNIYPLSLKNIAVQYLIYWWFPKVRIIPDINYKKDILQILQSDILEKEIFSPYGVKNTQSFRQVLTFLAEYPRITSLRELHKQISEYNIQLSLQSLTEYIQIALTTKILFKQEIHDIKWDKTFTSKYFYHFWDIWLKQSFYSIWNIDMKNILFLECLIRWYSVNILKNGVFYCDIFAKKDNVSYIFHTSLSTDPKVLRQTAHKIEKIPSDCEKYLVVLDTKKLPMRKLEESWVKIISLSEVYDVLER